MAREWFSKVPVTERLSLVTSVSGLNTLILERFLSTSSSARHSSSLAVPKCVCVELRRIYDAGNMLTHIKKINDERYRYTGNLTTARVQCKAA